MKISVVMAVCDGAEFLPAQLHSLLTQSRVPDEIVCVDDFSADDSPDILANFSVQYPGKFRVFRHNQRMGVDLTFSDAIKHCGGDVIFLADQDDVWCERKIEIMSAKIVSGGGVFCDSSLMDSELRVYHGSHLRSRGVSAKEYARLAEMSAESLFNLQLRRPLAAGHDLAFSADCARYLLPFPDLPASYDSWISLVLSALGKFSCVPEELTRFRRHAKSASDSGKTSSLSTLWRTAAAAAKTNTAAWNERLFSELISRLRGEIPDSRLSLLECRRRHSAARASCAVALPHRVLTVSRELINGNYFRFGGGLLSALQDLLWRKGEFRGGAK